MVINLRCNDLENALSNLRNALQTLENKLQNISITYELPPSNIKIFDKPSSITCGPRYRDDGKIILKRTKKDKLLCVLKGYRNFYFEKWDPSDSELYNTLDTEDFSENFVAIKIIKVEIFKTFQTQTIKTEIGNDVIKYCIICPKNNPDIREKVRILLYATVTENQVTKYLIQTLLGYKKSEIKRFYEIKYSDWKKKFDQDKDSARKLIKEAQNKKIPDYCSGINNYKFEPLFSKKQFRGKTYQTQETCTLW